MSRPRKPTFDARVLRFRRESLGITQSELARVTGLHPSTIRRLESGEARATAETIRRIEKTLGAASGDIPRFAEISNKIEKPLRPTQEVPSRKERNRLVGAVIGRLRREQNITQSELAARVGVARLTLRDWEAGRRGPNSDFIHVLAQVLKVDPWVFLDTKARTESQAVDPKEAVRDQDFDIHFDPGFSADEVKKILTALATYYRACGGVGFEVHFQREEVLVEEPVDA